MRYPLLTVAVPLWREIAHCAEFGKQSFAGMMNCVRNKASAAAARGCVGGINDHSYPPPDRPAYSPSRPVSVWLPAVGAVWVAIGYQGGFAVDAVRICAGGAVLNMIKKGNQICKRHQSYWPSWQASGWRDACRAIQSAASRAQVRGLSRQRFWAPIKPAQCLQGPRWACSAMMQASAAAAEQTRDIGPTARLFAHNTFRNRFQHRCGAARPVAVSSL